MNEDKAARYHRLRRRAIVAAAAWSFLLLIVLLGGGLSPVLRDAAEAAAGESPLPQWLATALAGAVFASIVFAIHEAGALPLAFWGSHVLDRRYGLSRQPASAWGRDHLKVLAVGWAVTAAAGGLTAACLTAWPQGWWLALWGSAVLASVAAAWAAPAWILPLFFRFAPLSDEPLRRRLADLAARAGVPVIGVFEWRLSDRTSRANAALVGLGSTRRIVVSDTLLADYSPDEVEVVLAHELSHHVHRDLWRGMLLEGAILGLAFWAAGASLPALASAAGLSGPTDLAALPAVALLVMSVSGASVPLVNALSRAHERRADRFALALTNRPDAFAAAIRRLAARNLAEDDPSWLVRLLFSTHPPVRERLDLARRWAAR